MARLTRLNHPDAIPLPEGWPVLSMVREVKVRRRVHQYTRFTSRGHDYPPPRLERNHPQPHAPIVEELKVERDVVADYEYFGVGNTFAFDGERVVVQHDCGDRDEEWTLNNEFAEAVREVRSGHRHAGRDWFELMAGLSITVSQAARDEMARGLRRLGEAMTEATRETARARARRTLDELGGAHVVRPRLDDLSLPQITVEGHFGGRYIDRAPLVTPAHYQAFVEWGAPNRTAALELPREQDEDETDVMNYVPPTPAYAGRAHVVMGNMRLAGEVVWANDIRSSSSPVTPEMNERADALLRSLLTPAQREQLDRDGHFDVTAQGGRRYRLSKYSRSYNVSRLDLRGRVVERLCAYPKNSYALPMADQLIAQMLMLKSDEKAFLRIANHSR